MQAEDRVDGCDENIAEHVGEMDREMTDDRWAIAKNHR